MQSKLFSHFDLNFPMITNTNILACFFLLSVGGALAQQKAQIHITKTVNGIESHETREVVLGEGQQLEDILQDINEQGRMDPSVLNQHIEISIYSTDEQTHSPQAPQVRSRANDLTWNRLQQRRPLLGVVLRDNPQINEASGNTKQVVITEVISNTPAERAGLHNGDIILSINTDPVLNAQQVFDHVKKLEPRGGELKMIVKRNKRKKKIIATIPGKPIHTWGSEDFALENDPNQRFKLGGGDSILFLQPFDLGQEGFTQIETAYLGVTPSNTTTTAGVSIQVEDKTPASEMGLIDGDIILEINGIVIGDFAALSAEVRKCSPGSTVELLINRDHKEKRISGTLGKRSLNAANDFQIFQDYKGMDDEGNFFFDFEFNMDADDLEQQMEELFKNLGGNPSIEGYKIPETGASSYLFRLEDVGSQLPDTLSTAGKSLVFDQLSFVPRIAEGNIEVHFALPGASAVIVQLTDHEGNTLMYDETPLVKGNYQRTLAFSAYPAGDYFIHIEQAGSLYVKKIVKYKP